MAKKTKKPDLNKSVAKVVRAAHERGEDVDITEYPGGKKEVTTGKDRQKSKNDGILNRLHKELYDYEEPLTKKTYRSNDQLPFPKLGSRAEENREKKAIGLRLPPELIERMNTAVKSLGLERTAWITTLIERELDNIEADLEDTPDLE